MKTSQQGIDFIKQFEGLRLQAYKPVQTEKYYTIGYGHYGPDVSANMQITESVAEELLKKDLVKYEDRVNKYNSLYNFNQHEFDALVSFAYNCGNGNLDKLVNYGQRTINDIRLAWRNYNKAGGKVLNGLVRRRQAELDMFNTFEHVHDTDINESVPAPDDAKLISGFVACDFKVTATSLRIREGMSTNHKQVGSLPNGSIVHVTHLYKSGIYTWGCIGDNKYICTQYDDHQYAAPYLQRNIVEYSLATNGELKLSDNFKVKEFKCKDGSDKILIDHYLVYFLQLIRNHFGKAVNINSGYRTVSYNKKVGGASKSQHLQGAAADIHINGVTPLQIAQYAEAINMQGIGLYQSFCHVDTRTNKSFWYGSGQQKRNTFI